MMQDYLINLKATSCRNRSLFLDASPITSARMLHIYWVFYIISRKCFDVYPNVQTIFVVRFKLSPVVMFLVIASNGDIIQCVMEIRHFGHHVMLGVPLILNQKR